MRSASARGSTRRVRSSTTASPVAARATTSSRESRGGLLILGVVAAQTAYFVAGPGAPEPTPSTSTSPSPTTTPDPSASPAATPDPSATPAPTATPTTADEEQPRTTRGPLSHVRWRVSAPVLGLGAVQSPTGGESRDEVHPVTAAAESTPASAPESAPETTPDADASEVPRRPATLPPPPPRRSRSDVTTTAGEPNESAEASDSEAAESVEAPPWTRLSRWSARVDAAERAAADEPR